MKNKKQKLKNLHIILDSVLRDMNENANKLSLAEEFNLDEIYGDKDPKTVLEKEDAFVVHCMNIKHILITIMYCINEPKLLEKIKEYATIEAMKHEMTQRELPDEFVDTFLDYVNFTKKREVN